MLTKAARKENILGEFKRLTEAANNYPETKTMWSIFRILTQAAKKLDMLANFKPPIAAAIYSIET